MIEKLISLFQESAQSFEGQEAGETVLLIIRKHPITVLIPLFFVFLFLFVPPAVWLRFGNVLNEAGLRGFFCFLGSLWYLILWLLSFYLLTFYVLNTVIITDKRIIEREQHHFFKRKTSELHAYRVQDVSVHINGLIETIFSFGDIVVQTAASEREFIFHQIAHPEKVKDVIMRNVIVHRSNLGLK